MEEGSGAPGERARAADEDSLIDTATTFECERGHLFGVAYRMLGSAAEAEDILQLVARARAHVDESRPRYEPSHAKKQELLAAFLAACATSDATALGRVLAADVVARSDGGGKVHAALKPVMGRDRVTRFLLGVLKKAPPDGVGRVAWVNGEPGFVLRTGEGTHTVLTLSIASGAITDVWIVVNPDKLGYH